MPCTLLKPCVLSSQLVERGREPMRFLGRKIPPGAARQFACLALILMGDWCGLLNKPDTTETKTRARRHQALCGRHES